MSNQSATLKVRKYTHALSYIWYPVLISDKVIENKTMN